MRFRNRSILLFITALWLGGCSVPHALRTLAQDAVAAMGGAEKLQGVKSLAMKGGTGSRVRTGQMVKPTDQENHAQLKDVDDIADLGNGRPSPDYALKPG